MFLAHFFGKDPDEIMLWRESKRGMYAARAAHVKRDGEQLQAVESAHANNVAFMNPKKLSELLPDKYKHKRSKRINKTQVDKEAALRRAEEIRQLPDSGSSIHEEN